MPGSEFIELGHSYNLEVHETQFSVLEKKVLPSSHGKAISLKSYQSLHKDVFNANAILHLQQAIIHPTLTFLTPLWFHRKKIK